MWGTARIDRYAHQVTTGKGMAGRWLAVEIITLATLHKPKPVHQ